MKDLFDLGIGTIPGWLTLVGLLTLGWIMYRGQAGPAVAYLQTANTVLEKEVEELKRKVKLLEEANAELRAKTDISVAIKPVIDWTIAHEHADEHRHQEVVSAFQPLILELERHTSSVLNVLELIAARLGPEPNNET